MLERAAQLVLLVRAFEEVDRAGRVLPLHERVAATRRAVMVTSSEGSGARITPVGTLRNEETLTRRARLLYRGLSRRIPALPRVLEFARLHSLMGPAFFVLALGAGLGVSFAGPRERLTILPWPLFVLLAWNVAAYAWAALAPLAGSALSRRIRPRAAAKARDGSGGEGWTHGLTRQVVRIALWRSRVGWRRRPVEDPDRVRVVDRSFVRFCALWHRLTRPLLESRVRRRLHLGAMALVGGVIGGMWLRGEVLEHRASWDSRLLDARHVQALLETVLAPATLLVGRGVPDVQPLRAPGAGAATIWIELFAATALLLVFLPRGALAVFEAWRGSRLKRALAIDYDDGYYRHALADWRGATRRVEVVPCGYDPTPSTLEHVRGVLQDFFGAQADMRVGARLPLDHGNFGELAAMTLGRCPEGVREAYLIVLFDLAQSPDPQVHGAFLEALRAHLEPHGCRIVVLCDASAYRQRESFERCAERQRSWDAVVAAAGLKAVHIDGNRATLGRRVAQELGSSLAARPNLGARDSP